MKKTIVAVLLGGGVIAALIGLAPDIISWLTNEPPQAAIELNTTSGEAPLKVIANVDAFDPDNDDLEISWILDGELQTKGSITSYEFEFTIPGNYIIEIIVDDGNKNIQKKQLVIVKAPIKKIANISLDAPLVINDPASDYEISGEILTNGFAINLIINRMLGGSAQIRSFPPRRADSGRRGVNGNNDRHGDGGKGQDGSAGANGRVGKSANNGRSAGPIKLVAKEIVANLIISNRGQSGGNGGPGGNGGNGGNGGQGKPSSAGFSIGGVGNCRSGPGHGGNGGNGGDGGIGGDAGNGGSGGSVFIEADVISGSISINVLGGQPGSPGAGGESGKSGRGGAEGALNGPCGSAGRIGSNGSGGNGNSSGSAGTEGDNGDIEIVLGGNVETSQSGEYKKVGP